MPEREITWCKKRDLTKDNKNLSEFRSCIDLVSHLDALPVRQGVQGPCDQPAHNTLFPFDLLLLCFLFFPLFPNSEKSPENKDFLNRIKASSCS